MEAEINSLDEKVRQLAHLCQKLRTDNSQLRQQLGGVNLASTIMAANPLFNGGSGLANVQALVDTPVPGEPARRC